MPNRFIDVIVIGTGAGGGMAIHTLCQAGAKVCALNASRRLESAAKISATTASLTTCSSGASAVPSSGETSIGYMDNEYSEGHLGARHRVHHGPGTEWTWRRCFAVGGKTNFWGRSSARFGEIDFRAATRDGYDVDWPIT